jgi:phage-related protein
VKPIRIHKKVEKELNDLDVFTRSKIMELLAVVAKGGVLVMPVSKPMPSVEHGVHELRLKAEGRRYRVFYFVKYKDAILVFHSFQKKTQKTPDLEIETGRRRLGEML